MPSALLSAASALQLIGLAVVVIMVILLGARVVGTGAKGFASLLGEVGGLLVGLYIVARPNDVTGLLTRAVGGVQTPAAITGAAAPGAAAPWSPTATWYLEAA